MAATLESRGESVIEMLERRNLAHASTLTCEDKAVDNQNYGDHVDEITRDDSRTSKKPQEVAMQESDQSPKSTSGMKEHEMSLNNMGLRLGFMVNQGKDHKASPNNKLDTTRKILLTDNKVSPKINEENPKIRPDTTEKTRKRGKSQ